MNALYALVAVAILFLIAYLGIAGADLRPSANSRRANEGRSSVPPI